METGIVLYTIESDGCLNGVYTNDDLHGEIFNEIARLKYNDRVTPDEISGDYDCVYFDIGNTQKSCELIVDLIHLDSEFLEYRFVWNDSNGRREFEGIGYRMNDKQIAVHYRYVAGE